MGVERHGSQLEGRIRSSAVEGVNQPESGGGALEADTVGLIEAAYK